MRFDKIFCSLLLASLSGFQPGCGGTIGGNPGRTIHFAIADAPVDGAQNVYIKVASLAIKQEAGDWLEIPLTVSEEIDLLELQNGRSQSLAALESLPEGVYTEVRLVLDEESPARLIDKDNAEHALKVPSGSESGLKIKTSFTITDTTSKDFIIDFDLRKSLKQNGNGQGKYTLHPVLRLMESKAQGGVQGQAETDALVCAYAEGVTSFDAECADAVTTSRAEDSAYVLAHLPEGSYTIVFYKTEELLATKAGIEVKAGELTSVNQLP